LGCRPVDRVDADRLAMLALPPVPPATGWRSATRLPRDHYLRFDSNDYSVHPGVIGRTVEMRADLARVQVWCHGKLVADHARVWAKHQTVSDFEHLVAAKMLRRERVELVRPAAAQTEVAVRDLTDYDTVLGLAAAVSDGAV
jgi:hypothetical protein